MSLSVPPTPSKDSYAHAGAFLVFRAVVKEDIVALRELLQIPRNVNAVNKAGGIATRCNRRRP